MARNKQSKSTDTSTPVASNARAGGDLSPQSDISAFLSKASTLKSKSGGRGGLIFALDATMSRQHTWDHALHVQAQMFDAVASVGTLDVQLAYFRGMGECRASRWVQNGSSLRDLMTGIACRGGQTQIGKILNHCRKETSRSKDTRVRAAVFVGDAMEENPDTLCVSAGELGVLGVPMFMFQEGRDGLTEQTFREISRLSGGAYMRFGDGSAAQLAELLKAVARFAAGGRGALTQSKTSEARLLLEQLK